MRAMLSAFSAVSSNSGTDSRARSTYSRTAAVDEIAPRSVVVGAGTSRGGTRYSCSLVSRSGTRLVARSRSDGTAASSVPSSANESGRCSRLSTTTSVVPS